MERLSGTTRQFDPDFLREHVAGLATCPVDEAIEIATGALAPFKSDAATARARVELDRSVVRGLREHPDLDSILAALPVESVGRLLERSTATIGDPAEMPEREATWEALDLVRRSSFVQRIAHEEVSSWSARILAAVEASHFTVGPLFRQRVDSYESDILFQIPGLPGTSVLTWRQTATRVEQIAAGLISLDANDEPGPVAILSANRLEMALVDLACLTTGWST